MLTDNSSPGVSDVSSLSFDSASHTSASLMTSVEEAAMMAGDVEEDTFLDLERYLWYNQMVLPRCSR